jgi:hypothetical protein
MQIKFGMQQIKVDLVYNMDNNQNLKVLAKTSSLSKKQTKKYLHTKCWNPALLSISKEEKKSKISLSRNHRKYSLIACNFGTIKKELPWVIQLLIECNHHS